MRVINPYKMFQGSFIPNAIMECRDLSQSAKLLWGRLAQYAGENGRCFPKLKTLGRDIGLTRDGVKKVVRELQNAGLIIVKAVKTENGTNQANEYFFLDHPIFYRTHVDHDRGPSSTPPGVTPVPPGGDWGTPGGVTGVPTEENQLRESEKEQPLLSEKISDAVSEKKQRFHGSDEDHQLARRIYEAVLVVNATVKEPNWNRWANTIRLMREQDKRGHDEIWNVFDYANRDTFWSNNILSPDSLRKQFSRLAPKAGMVRSRVPGVGADVPQAADREHTCGECHWVKSGKWFCRADGKADHQICDRFRPLEV